MSCCAAPSIMFRPQDPPPKILASEQLQFHRWVDKRVSNNPMLYVVEGGGEMLLPRDDAIAYVFAANEAERLNGEKRFFLELQLLMQEAGHHVIIDDAANVEAPSQDSSTKKQWLLHGRDISELEYATMHNNIVRRQASEEEKWLAFRYEYMEAWGIRMISEAFIDANGTQCGSLRLSRLRRLLQPAATRYCLAERELTPAQKQDIMRVGAVEEVINALGLKGPFDTAHTIEDLSSGEVRERVLNTECFKSWADMRRIFNTQASKTVWKTSSDVMGTIRVILDSIGLAVSAKRFREREAGTEVRPHSYKYWLSADAANNMQELLALKDGDIERAGKWAHLLKQRSGDRPTVESLQGTLPATCGTEDV